MAVIVTSGLALGLERGDWLIVPRRLALEVPKVVKEYVGFTLLVEVTIDDIRGLTVTDTDGNSERADVGLGVPSGDWL